MKASERSSRKFLYNWTGLQLITSNKWLLLSKEKKKKKPSFKISAFFYTQHYRKTKKIAQIQKKVQSPTYPHCTCFKVVIVLTLLRGSLMDVGSFKSYLLFIKTYTCWDRWKNLRTHNPTVVLPPLTHTAHTPKLSGLWKPWIRAVNVKKISLFLWFTLSHCK